MKRRDDETIRRHIEPGQRDVHADPRDIETRWPLTVSIVAPHGTLLTDAGAPGLPPDASWVTMSAPAGQSFAASEFTD